MIRRPGASPGRAGLGGGCWGGGEGSGDDRHWSDQGAAGLLVLVWLCVLVALVCAGLALLGVWNTHGRAQGAADLAALAGAGRVLEGAEPSCRAAERVARANSATLTGCRVVGSDVWVTVRLPVPPGLARAALMGRSEGITGKAHATISLGEEGAG